MPSGTAGITRYFDEYKSKIRFKPGHVVIIGVLVVLITVLLHAYGSSMMGLS